MPEHPLGAAHFIRDVAEILRGRSLAQEKDYTLATLSHLAHLLGQTSQQLPTKEWSKVNSALRKTEFLLSWANDNNILVCSTGGLYGH